MRVAPLPSSFMLIGILGFLISVFYIMKLDETWGFTFTLFFILVFIASVIAMTRAEYRSKGHLQQLAVHEQIHKRKR